MRLWFTVLSTPLKILTCYNKVYHERYKGEEEIKGGEKRREREGRGDREFDLIKIVS